MIPILRTRIVQTSMGLHQVVMHEDIDWNEENITNIPCISLGSPLNYFSIQQQGKVLKWISHHATYDGISTNLILDLVEQAYSGTSPDPAGIADYRLFVKYTTQLSMEASQSYWAAEMAEASPGSFPSVPSGISQICANSRLQTTLKLTAPPSSAIIRAAWGLLISAYTSSDDVVFGTILSGRNAPVRGIEAMAGPTIATVPIRVRIDLREEIEPFLARLQTQAIEMIPHEHFGLQNIRRISDDIRHASDFQSLLVIQPAKEGGRNRASIAQPDEDTSSLAMNTYPIVLEVQLTSDGYCLDVSYDPSILAEVETKRVVDQFNHLVLQLSQRQSRGLSKVGEIQAISPADLGDIWHWNSNLAETINVSLHSLIGQKGLLTPDADAIVSWDGWMSYSELDRASSELAHEISSRDKSIGSFVPICFEKSMWAVVAMLAVLKSGKAFAFLDAAYPMDRLQHMVSILEPVVAISSKKHRDICRQLVPDTIVLGPGTLKPSIGTFTPPRVSVKPSDPICASSRPGPQVIQREPCLPTSHTCQATCDMLSSFRWIRRRECCSSPHTTSTQPSLRF